MHLELGKVVGVWGVKGWIKLHAYTRQRDDIAKYSRWWLKPSQSAASPVGYEVLVCRQQGPGIVAQLEGVDTREAAQALNGQIILIDQDDLPDLPPGEYYWRQLIGLTVTNLQAEDLGMVESMFETGANDVLVLKRQVNGATQELLIPYTPEVVKRVDLENGSMTVDWDPSYLD